MSNCDFDRQCHEIAAEVINIRQQNADLRAQLEDLRKNLIAEHDELIQTKKELTQVDLKSIEIETDRDNLQAAHAVVREALEPLVDIWYKQLNAKYSNDDNAGRNGFFVIPGEIIYNCQQIIDLSPTTASKWVTGIAKSAQDTFKRLMPTCRYEDCPRCTATTCQCAAASIGRALAEYRGGADEPQDKAESDTPRVVWD